MLSLKLPSILEIKSIIAFSINWLQSNWTNIFLSSLLIYLLIAKNITLELSLKNGSSPSKKTQPNNKPTKNLQATTASLSSTTSPLTKAQKEQINYVRRFAKVAQGEMQKYGIPASITLAQGLLESKAGNSPLATKNNNHFGIKCFSKQCQKGHCSNFSDDSHKDFFKNYKTAWESYRAHSEFLQGNRYKHLLQETDYKTWANGLVAAGYATDQAYGKKLISLIEVLELYRYDEVG